MIRTVFLTLLVAAPLQSEAQPCATTLHIVNSRKELDATTQGNPDRKMVPLQSIIPGLALDLRYGTTNNFTHTVLYSHPAGWMRQGPALALKEVQKELTKRGLALKIYDAYRPFSTTCRIWQLVPDKRYAANPRKGSHHNRGLAVDLTIIDLKTGRELDMGTSFDNFTDSAHHDFAQLPLKALENRRLLKHLMWKYGFNFVPTEWWHYHWRNKDFEVLDIPFDELK